MSGPDDDLDAAERNSSGIWSLDGERLASVQDFDEGPAVVLVPSERVLLLAVSLPPIASAAKRRAALPFAVEERVAEPIDEVHVALGAELAPNTYLVGVVRHDLMRRWVQRLEEAGLEQASLVPDALSLPRPHADSWSVDLAAQRAVIRSADGTGFALSLDLLEQAWKAAGEPQCAAYGDSLPPPMHAPALDLQAEPMAERLTAPDLDLRQGLYAPPRRSANPLWKRAAIVAALGALAHLAIAFADLIALRQIAEEREEEVRTLAQNMQPSFTVGPDMAETIAEITPDGPIAAPSPFLALLAGAATALGQTQAVWRSVSYDGAAQVLTVELETDSVAALQSAAAALERAGFDATPGAATSDQGRMIGSFSVRGR